jgi:hypothetical protein
MFGNIDMRKEIDIMIQDYGFKVLYVRNSKFIKCKCVDPLYKVGYSECPICLGTGKLTSLEQTNIIQSTVTPKEMNTSIGLQNRTNLSLVLRFDENPVMRDLILYTSFSKTGIAQNVLQVFEIVRIHPSRCDNGRIEYFSVDCILRSDIVDLLNHNVHHLSSSLKNELKIKGAIQWPYKEEKS